MVANNTSSETQSSGILIPGELNYQYHGMIIIGRYCVLSSSCFEYVKAEHASLFVRQSSEKILLSALNFLC